MFVLCCHYRVLFYHLSFHCSARKKKQMTRQSRMIVIIAKEEKVDKWLLLLSADPQPHTLTHMLTLSHVHTHTHTRTRIHTRTDKASHSEATHACISEACGHVGLGSRVLGGGKEVKEQEGSAIGGGRGDKG